MTSEMPLFSEHTGLLDQFSGSDPHISSRLNQRMITPRVLSPAPTGEAQLPDQFIGHYGPSPYGELTARCYHVLQIPHCRSLPSSCDSALGTSMYPTRSNSRPRWLLRARPSPSCFLVFSWGITRLQKKSITGQRQNVRRILTATGSIMPVQIYPL